MFRALLLLLFLSPSLGYARLGDTLEAAQTRYGKPNAPLPEGIQTPLIEGAQEFTFEHQGWRIRCALLKATDGKEYVVREQYIKVTSPATLRAGASAKITDEERDGILQGELITGTWEQKTLAELGKDLLSNLGTQLAQTVTNLGSLWLRTDGARANVSILGSTLLLELPHAAKYDAELKSIRGANAQASVPKR